MKKAFSVLGASLLLAGSLLAAFPQQDQQPAPDNTKTNQGDAGKNATTADQQKMNEAASNDEANQGGAHSGQGAVDLRPQHKNYHPKWNGHSEGAGPFRG